MFETLFGYSQFVPKENNGAVCRCFYMRGGGQSRNGINIKSSKPLSADGWVASDFFFVDVGLGVLVAVKRPVRTCVVVVTDTEPVPDGLGTTSAVVEEPGELQSDAAS